MQPDAQILFESHLAWARSLSARLAHAFRVRPDDAEADALVGLWDAARRYAPDSAAPFRGYARVRIRGAILDGRRALAGRHRERPTFVTLDSVDLVDRSESATDRVERDEEIAHALAALPSIPLTVVTGRLAGETLAAIGRRVKRSPSAVSRIAARALGRLAKGAA